MEMTTKNIGEESNKVIIKEGWKKIIEGENLTETMVVVFEFDGYQVFKFCMYEESSKCKRVRNEVSEEVTEVESEEESKRSSDDIEGDEEEEEKEEEEESTQRVDSLRRKRKGGARLYLKDDERRRYLDNFENPSFKVDRTLKRSADLRIPAELRKDYTLEFPKFVTLVDKIGELERKISVWKNNSVYLKGFKSVYLRNDVKETDELICELKTNNRGLVTEIKVHVIKM